MAQAARKLQAEIDRTLKKVQEGQEIFEDIWQKVIMLEHTFAEHSYIRDFVALLGAEMP